MCITTIADSYVQINYSLSLSLSLNIFYSVADLVMDESNSIVVNISDSLSERHAHAEIF